MDVYVNVYMYICICIYYVQYIDLGMSLHSLPPIRLRRQRRPCILCTLLVLVTNNHSQLLEYTVLHLESSWRGVNSTTVQSSVSGRGGWTLLPS